MKTLKHLMCTCFLLLQVLLSAAQGTWSGVSGGLNAQALCMTAYSGKLYIGKLNFSIPDEINAWDGSKLTAPGGGTNGPVGAFVISGSDLYVGGGFTGAGGHPAANVAKWNGTSWSAVGAELDNFAINALALYKGDIYAAGYSFTPSGTAAALTIARWNGTKWTGVGSGLQGGDVYALEVYGDELYAAGSFTNAGSIGTSHIAKWDGTAWSAVSTGSNGKVIYTLKAYAGSLYAGGDFSSIGGKATTGIAGWDGSSWSSLGMSGGTDNTVIALATHGSDLYVGGAFGTVGGITANHIAKWNGTAWSALGAGVGASGTPTDQVWCIADYMGDLYVAGVFSATGDGTAAVNIARWSEATAVQEQNEVISGIQVSPNPLTTQSVLSFHTNFTGPVTVEIYDIQGRLLLRQTKQEQAGDHTYPIGNLEQSVTGVCTIRVTVNNETKTQQIVLNR